MPMPRWFSNLSYQSVKFVEVKDPWLAVTYYLLMAGILAYVIIYTIILEKGYQAQDSVVASTMTKVKGSTYFNISNPPPPNTTSLETDQFLIHEYIKAALVDAPAPEWNVSNSVILDSIDLVLPAFVPNEIFIATGGILTPSQTRGTCPGNDATYEMCNCSQAPANYVQCGCTAGQTTPNGLKIGTCSTGTYCDLYAWCPLENSKDFLTWQSVANWTIYIRVNGRFPNFDIFVSNVNDQQTAPVPDQSLWSLGELLRLSGYTYNQIKNKGAILGILFKYNCDFDKSSDCQPTITVSRLDPNQSAIATGFNYRLGTKYHINGTEYRDLQKVVGVRMILQVAGSGAKFNFATLTVTLGAGLALLGISTFVCDILMENIFPKREIYNKHKYEMVKSDEKQPEKNVSEKDFSNGNA